MEADQTSNGQYKVADEWAELLADEEKFYNKPVSVSITGTPGEEGLHHKGCSVIINEHYNDGSRHTDVLTEAQAREIYQQLDDVFGDN